MAERSRTRRNTLERRCLPKTFKRMFVGAPKGIVKMLGKSKKAESRGDGGIACAAMPFAYYDRLSPPRKRIYRQSDAIGSLPIPPALGVSSDVAAVRFALDSDAR